MGLDTSAAGSRSGTAAISLESDGTGTSDIAGNIALASQTVDISGDVFRLAQAGAAAPNPVDLGNVRVNDTAQQVLSLQNTAADDGYSENLNASFATPSNTDITASGSVSGLSAQDTNNTDLTVGIDTTTAGTKSGTVDLNLESDGDTINTLGQTSLTGQTVNVTGDVFRLAQAGAAAPNPVVLADAHVGDTNSQTLTITNTAAADGYSEKLNAAIAATGGSATASGSINLLDAQATDTTSLSVGLDTSSAGSKSGTAAISLESDGTGTSDIAGNIALASQTVDISGDVFRLAQAGAAAPNPVDLGNVHVGDVASQTLSITNTAVNDGYSENLNADFSATSKADITASGSISGLSAQATNNADLVVGMDTGTAGAKSGTVDLNLESDGDGINSLGQTALTGQTITVSGKVYRLAEATIDNINNFNFGNVHVGDTVAQGISISNTAVADNFSENLNATILANTNPGSVTATGSITGLAAGQTDNTSMSIGVDTSSSGAVASTVTLGV